MPLPDSNKSVDAPRKDTPAVEKKSEAQETKESKGNKTKKSGPVTKDKVAVDSQESPIDVGRLDFRVGKIVNAKKHPDADSLYVEEIDVGEAKYRTVVRMIAMK